MRLDTESCIILRLGLLTQPLDLYQAVLVDDLKKADVVVDIVTTVHKATVAVNAAKLYGTFSEVRGTCDGMLFSDDHFLRKVAL